MRLDFLKAGVRRLASGWFWALVLLALPNCSLERGGIVSPHQLQPGDTPRSSAIMCDIEKFQDPTRRCATPHDLAIGIPLAQAAEALVSGRSSNVGLEFSPAADLACGTGHPQAIDFWGDFPTGSAVCLNCGVIPTLHADATAVCIAQCRDLFTFDFETTDPPNIMTFCTANAKPSTHFPMSGCFAGACSGDGTLLAGFADPRRMPEAVIWRDPINVNVVGSNITQMSPSTGGDVFAAGAVSEQWVHSGDAYVEFEATENNLSHVVGFAEVPDSCLFPCTDSDPGFADIDFALSLNSDGRVYVLEPTAPGGIVPGPDINSSFGTYMAGERFRVRVKDNLDGTGTVSYTRIVGACVPGNPCNETVLFSHAVPPPIGSPADYTLRVAAAFREFNGTLANVNFVRIK